MELRLPASVGGPSRTLRPSHAVTVGDATCRLYERSLCWLAGASRYRRPRCWKCPVSGHVTANFAPPSDERPTDQRPPVAEPRRRQSPGRGLRPALAPDHGGSGRRCGPAPRPRCPGPESSTAKSDQRTGGRHPDPNGAALAGVLAGVVEEHPAELVSATPPACERALIRVRPASARSIPRRQRRPRNGRHKLLR